MSAAAIITMAGIGIASTVAEKILMNFGKADMAQFLNVAGFYDDLLKFIQLTTVKGFTHARFSESIIASDSIDQILQQFDAFQAPQPKWGMVDQQGLVK